MADFKQEEYELLKGIDVGGSNTTTVTGYKKDGIIYITKLKRELKEELNVEMTSMKYYNIYEAMYFKDECKKNNHGSLHS